MFLRAPSGNHIEKLADSMEVKFSIVVRNKKRVKGELLVVHNI